MSLFFHPLNILPELVAGGYSLRSFNFCSGRVDLSLLCTEAIFNRIYVA